MNKSQLIESISAEAGVDRAQVRAVIDTAVKTITQTLKSGESVTLIDFGSFDITKRAGRNGFNPRLNKPMKVKPTQVVKFTASAKLKGVAKRAKVPGK